jgi:hypothetical protein
MMQNLERLWPAVVMLVVIFGIRIARYCQKRWTREMTDTSFQVGWILKIYMHGFVLVALAYYFALSTVSIRSDYPKSIEDINNTEKVLQQFKEHHEAMQYTTRILMWFIFFCALWVSNLLVDLRSQLLTKSTNPNAGLPKDWR